MLGFFPADKSHDLTEWQQKNAVPPIKGADFSEWQKELGANALPYGLNVYPIEQVGLEVDRMLSINGDNCPRFKKEFTDPWTTASKIDTEGFSQMYPELGEKINSMGASLTQFCDYVNWADITGVTLQGKESDWTTIRQQHCDYEALQRQNMMNKLDLTDKNLISGSFLKEIGDTIDKLTPAAGSNAATLPTTFYNY